MRTRHSVADAAERLGVSARTLRRWIASGEVEATHLEGGGVNGGGRYVLTADQLERALNKTARDVEIVEDAGEPLATAPASEPTPAGMLGALATMLEDQRAASERASEAERRAWHVAVDRLEDTAAHLRGMLEDVRGELAAEREAHNATRARLEDVLRHHARTTQPVSLAEVHARLAERAEG